MSDLALSALVLAVTGIYAVRWTQRLAPTLSELPLKTIAATALAVLVVMAEFSGVDASRSVRLTATIVAGIFVLAPLVVTMFARVGAWRVAENLVVLAYWSQPARDGMRRVLAQLALRRGEATVAERLVPEHADVLRYQVWALGERWQDILTARPPRAEVGSGPADGDNLTLADEARLEALLATDRLDEADVLVRELEQKAQEPQAGPITRRVSQLAGARLSSARGRLDETRRRIVDLTQEVAPHTLYSLVAEAATRAHHPVAAELWRQTYAAAPPALRGRYEARLRALGATPPKVAHRQPYATLGLAAWIVLAYVLQISLDRWGMPVLTALGRIDPSSAAAAFLLNIPGPAYAEAWWRYLSYAFVHGSLLHIAFNTWVLVDLGRMYEARRVWGDVLGAFALGTAMGAYLSQIAQGGQPLVLVGASGGVLGIAGALLADLIRSPLPSDRRLMRSLLQWMALITLFSLAVPGVSLWGHVGGVVGGLLFGFTRQGLASVRVISGVVGGVTAGLLVSAFVSAVLTALGLW